MMLPKSCAQDLGFIFVTIEQVLNSYALSILVAGQLEFDPLSGHLFAFCTRKRDIIKIIYWDRNGFCLWHKRLEKLVPGSLQSTSGERLPYKEKKIGHNQKLYRKFFLDRFFRGLTFLLL